MQSTRKKIAFILAVIVLLPAIAITVYETITLNSNEAAIEEIYKNQLDAIIFSINQYSEDIVSNWSHRIESYLIDSEQNQEKFQNSLKLFLSDNNSISGIILGDSSLSSGRELKLVKGEIVTGQPDEGTIDQIKDSGKLPRLFTYQRGGYKKLEPIINENSREDVKILFTLNSTEMGFKLCVISIEPDVFISNILVPKIQSISRDELIISCRDTRTNDVIYSNAPLGNKLLISQKEMWLIPNVNVAIALKERSLEGLVKERSVSTIFLIGMLTLFLIVAVIILYRSVNKEIKFAQLKSDFVSNVSHELRTPLALISMFAETLEMNRVKNDEKRKEYYKIISQETGRLSRIVNSILNFSKMEAGKREFNKEIVDLNSIVTRVIETYDFHLANKGFTCEKLIADEELLIHADIEAVSEAVINLLDNAVKYSGETKKIIVGTKSFDGKVIVSVTDFGIGISDEDQKKVFDKFYRVSSGLVHNTKGTGMGLSLVKSIVDAHDGQVKVESKLGKGSTFSLIFPLNKN